MAGKPSTAQDAAERQFMKAPADAKPSVLTLARTHRLAPSSIHRAPWFKKWKAAQKAGVAK